MSVLAKIAASTRQRVATYKSETPLNALQAQALYQRQPRDFIAAFSNTQQPHIIAEIKRASPSRGPIAPELKPLDVAQAYLENGATALSILTEPEYFQGEPAILSHVRQHFPEALLLMKDFILDPYQLHLARACGADACLLMASLLDQQDLSTLYHEALALGLTPLLEVHDPQEMERAISLKAKLIGINNRNLKSLEVNLQTGATLAKQAPRDSTLICESGIFTAQQIQDMQQHGFHGFLVGTALMQSGQPGAALQALLGNKR